MGDITRLIGDKVVRESLAELRYEHETRQRLFTVVAEAVEAMRWHRLRLAWRRGNRG